MRALAGTCLSRSISHFVPEIRSRFPAADRELFLTFDDGPTEGTRDLLDVLAEQGVVATFFLIGSNAAARPELVQETITAGHAVGNHTFTHVDAWRSSPRQVVSELGRCDRVLEELTGAAVDLVRPPYGRVTPGMVRWCRRRRQSILLWDVMPPDFEPGRSPRGIAESLVRGVRPGSIVCLHDNAKARGVTCDALRIALPRLLDAGWSFRLPAACAGLNSLSSAFER